MVLVLLAIVAALLVGAVPAGAVTITEFDVEPGTALGVHLPRYIDTGPDGNLWFTDGGSRPGIGRIGTTGERFAQIASSNVPMDLAVAPDGSGTVYFTASNGLVRRTADGTVSEVPGRPPVWFGTSGSSYGIAFDPSGGLRWGQQRLGINVQPVGYGYCRFDNDGWSNPATCTDFPNGPAPLSLTGTVQGPGGRMWSAWYGLDFVSRTASPGIAIETRFDLPAGSGPSRVAVGADGNVWVTMFDASAIDRFTPDGTRTRFPLQPGRRPNDIVAGPDGALWFTEYGANRIGRITTSGDVTEYGLPDPDTRPIGITVGPDRAIWYTATYAGRIGQLVPDPPPPPPPPPGGNGGGGAGGGGTPGGSGAIAPPPIAPAVDRTSPAFTRTPVLTPSRFTVITRKRGIRRGSTLLLALSEPATITATIYRLATGRKETGRRPPSRCVAQNGRNRRRPACTRLVAAGTIRPVTATAGKNFIPFSGRIGRRALQPGRYRALITATDPAGNTAPPRTTRFTIAG